MFSLLGIVKKIGSSLEKRKDIILVFTSLVGTFIAVFAFRQTVNVAKLGQQQFALANRPYLSLVAFENNAVDNPPIVNSTQIKFDLSIKNFGKLPAYYIFENANSQNLPVQCFQSSKNFIMPDQTVTLKCLRRLGRWDSDGNKAACDLMKSEVVRISYGDSPTSMTHQVVLKRNIQDLPEFQQSVADQTVIDCNEDGKPSIFPWYVEDIK